MASGDTEVKSSESAPGALSESRKLRKFIGCYIVLAPELLLFPVYLSCVISISI